MSELPQQVRIADVIGILAPVFVTTHTFINVALERVSTPGQLMMGKIDREALVVVRIAKRLKIWI